MLNDKQRREIKLTFRALRLRAGGLTQIETATRAHVSMTRYWKLENGYERPTADEVKALARVFRVDVGELPAGEPVSA